MKAKKPFLVIVLVLAVLAVALVLPAVATGKSDNQPTAWANWARSGQYTGLKIFNGEEWVLFPVTWKAALAVHLQQRLDDGGDPVASGHEVMNWQSEFDTVGTGTPPWKHNRTTEIVEWKFDDLGDGAYRATLIFCYDTVALGWPERYTDNGNVYHVWVLTDNPGNGTDHVDLYTQMRPPTSPPDIAGGPLTWGAWALDLDCRGVQVVIK